MLCAPALKRLLCNGDDTLRYMQWLGEPDDLKRFVLRPSTNGGGYLGTTSMRWNTGFFTNTITQSDAKDKTHVQDLGENAFSFLSALRPVSFVFRDGEGGRTHLGLIAQEVAGAAAETGMGDLSLYQAVRLDEEGNEHPYSWRGCFLLCIFHDEGFDSKSSQKVVKKNRQKEKPHEIMPKNGCLMRFLWRKRWDSNPRAREDYLISRVVKQPKPPCISAYLLIGYLRKAL